MVGQAVEKRAGEALIAERRGPLVEGQVRGDDRGAAFVALADQLEQEFRPGARQRHEAQFIDDQQLIGGERLLQAQQALLVLRLDHLVHDGGGRGEAGLHAAVAGR